MDINLRKAKQIQQSINEAINAIPLHTNVQITEYDDPLKTIETTAFELNRSLFKRVELITALYKIRALVSTKNSTCGIDAKLTLIAEVQAKQELFGALSGIAPIRNLNEIVGMHDKLKNAEVTDSYGRINQQTFNSPVVDQATVDLYKAKNKELQALKVSLQDEVLELNLKTKIKLDEETVKILKEAGIV